MKRTGGNFGLGILAVIIGFIWLLKDVNVIPNWFPAWSVFLIILGAVLMWSGIKK